MAIRGGQIINISGKEPVNDPEYRYKMPAVFGKIEGRGNGIKTVIPNILDVGLSLHRNPSEVNKFFGCELGSQTTYSEETERAVVNGSHTDKTLQDLIHRYVEIFVLCPNCGLPETDYKIKNECIFHKCAACGAVDMVDMNHKLCTYILAQNKKAKKDKKDKEKELEKEKKKDGKDEKKKDKKKDSDDEKKKDKKDKEKKKDKKKEDKKKDDKKKDKKEKEGEKDKGGNYIEEALLGKKEDDFDDDADGQDSVDTEVGVDDAGAMELAVEGTKKFLMENPDATVDAISEAVTNQQMASALKSQDKIHIFVRAAFTPQFFKSKEVEKYASAVAKITNKGINMERHLIAALEGLCIDKPKNFPVFIKQLYDEDALDEDVILEWAAEGRNDFTLPTVDEETRATLRGEAEPVVVWLQAADSDDEESDDEE